MVRNSGKPNSTLCLHASYSVGRVFLQVRCEHLKSELSPSRFSNVPAVDLPGFSPSWTRMIRDWLTEQPAPNSIPAIQFSRSGPPWDLGAGG